MYSTLGEVVEGTVLQRFRPGSNGTLIAVWNGSLTFNVFQRIGNTQYQCVHCFTVAEVVSFVEAIALIDSHWDDDWDV